MGSLVVPIKRELKRRTDREAMVPIIRTPATCPRARARHEAGPRGHGSPAALRAALPQRRQGADGAGREVEVDEVVGDDARIRKGLERAALARQERIARRIEEFVVRPTGWDRP